MEKGFQSWWFNSQQADWQAFNLNSSSAQFEFGRQHSVLPSGNACTNMFSPDVRSGSFPPFAFSAEQPSKASLPIPNERRGWFYCMPRFRAVNSMPKEKFVVDEKDSRVGVGASSGVQKRFLVFDQSGDDKTTLIFSSVNGAPPVHCLPKPLRAFELKKEEVATKGENVHSYLPSPVDECSEESEMHEDTEELNALLYSDSDDEIDPSDKDEEEEEEASTGHSPCTMTVYDYVNVNENGEEEEEIASCGGRIKRQKLGNGGYDVISLTNSSSSLKTKCTVDNKDDKNEKTRASDESDSVSSNKRLLSTKDKVLDESESVSGNKRLLSRKDKVRETISVLQNLIPGLKECEEPIVVIDEAIHYLRLLKAKTLALGLD